MNITRREFGGLVAGGAILARTGGLGAAQTTKIAGVRVGTQSYSYRDRSLTDAIAAMQALGLSYCELWSGHIDRDSPVQVPPGGNRREATRAWRLASSTLDYFQAVRKRFETAGVTLTSFDIPFNNDYTDEEIAAVFEHGKALGVSVITSSAQVSVAPRVEPFAAKANMRVGFHNHSRIAPNAFATPDDFATAMKAGPHMAITLDIGHFTAANFDALAFLEEHHEHILTIHLKDRKRDQGGTFMFGEGDAPIANVLTMLRDKNWDIPAQIEYEYRGEGTDAEMAKMLAFCRKTLESK